MTDSLILAGGKSTRFKSDKALAHFNDVVIPNVKYTADLTSPLVKNCFVSTNSNNHSTVKNLFNNQVNVIQDVAPLIDCGPMSALWSYFKTTNKTSADLIVVATDYIIDKSAIEFLSLETGYIKIKSVPYYTCCHLNIKIELLKKYMTEQNYRWRSLLKDANCPARNFDGRLKNINYLEDLK
ncbi:molybdopterin-guanine dinucleotide biosynthesis protein A [Companilactobacillus tucceti DSM 20183]|uniref:Molybdopterin-guanine dinucleotide biosynthesis protein A n=1 Tax=Companilactobacillus tucceti DSM 20183 TaxID=1423811 RepID=A0A0R1J368_9LACO|nr:NTP transferase domain-containing protein [Companilactobacillus tucceti]KRK65733.1 molybdopterin-guanine dinucleotide biosynthesis protein A [Companilactobacillus tucceti DSM 20183]